MIKTFKLGGTEWVVEINDEKLTDRGAYGTCDYATSEILLQEYTEGRKRKKDAIEQTLYHEVVHAILFSIGETDLAGNERFIQNFSLLLHQFEISKK